MHEPNAAQAEYWDEATAGWLAVEQHSEPIRSPFGDLAMERLGLAAGQRVLDIGCGSGATTLALAERVGPTGTASGIDIAPGMITAARQLAAESELTNASFLTIDAQTSDLHGPFDAVYSRFGVMFFSDPVAAFANVASVVVRNGRVAFCCWRDVVDNEWMFAPGAAAFGVIGAAPPRPAVGEPGPFSMADADVVTAMLGAAGYEDVEVDPIEHLVVLPESDVESIAQLMAHVGPVREALRTADEDTAAAIGDAVRATLAERVVDGELRLHAAANVVTACVSGWRR